MGNEEKTVEDMGLVRDPTADGVCLVWRIRSLRCLVFARRQQSKVDDNGKEAGKATRAGRGGKQGKKRRILQMLSRGLMTYLECIRQMRWSRR